MQIALAALCVAAAAAVFLVGAWLLIRPRYLLPTPADETHSARTEDGWDLALYRYRPTVPVHGREPVVLCHGMLSNRYNVDLDEEVSLARHLRGRGFDCWVMELRGHGGSRRTAADGAGNGPFDWTMDDYIRHDLPAAVAHVVGATGSERVHWFGHSMGGMILYGHCAMNPAPLIRSAVLTDAPASFERLKGRARAGRIYGKLFPAVPPALVIPFLTPIVWLLPEVMAPRYGISNRRRMVSLLNNAIIPWGSSKVLLQICDMLESGRFRSGDGAVDYEEGPGRIEFPLLVISAGRRRLDEEVVKCGFTRAASADKKYVKLSRADGYSTDYTHSNLLVADSSPAEVFPLIAEWFLQHSSA